MGRPGARHRLVLHRIKLRQFLGKNFPHVTADQLGFGLQSTALDQRLVDRQVAAQSVLDKKSRLGFVIEKLLDNGQLRCQRPRRC